MVVQSERSPSQPEIGLLVLQSQRLNSENSLDEFEKSALTSNENTPSNDPL